MSEAGTPRHTGSMTGKLTNDSKKPRRSKTKLSKKRRAKKNSGMVSGENDDGLDDIKVTRRSINSGDKGLLSSRSNRSAHTSRSKSSARSRHSSKSSARSKRNPRDYEIFMQEMMNAYEESSEADSIDPDNYETESDTSSKKAKKKQEDEENEGDG